MSFSLRNYQVELILDIKKSMLAGHRKIMVQSPPRSGKTVCMAHIAKNATDKQKTVLFFSHRKEINEQVFETFERAGVDMGLVYIGTVGSIVRKLGKLPLPTLILVDEAHHIKASQYQQILKYYHQAVQLFFTGTPIRLDGSGFDDMADDLVVGKSILWLQEHGNISEFDYYSINLLDQAKLKKRQGEYTNQSIDDSFDFKQQHGDYLSHYERLAKGKQAIVYCHSVEYAERVSKRFYEAGYQSAVVSGRTPKVERERAMRAFRDGEVTIMVNVNLFTEGIDLPGVDSMRSKIDNLESREPVIIYQVDNAGTEMFGKVTAKDVLESRYYVEVKPYGKFLVTREQYEEIEIGQEMPEYLKKRGS